MPEGLLGVWVPQGSQNLRVDIPVSFTEYLGRLLSALGVFFCLLLSLGKWIGRVVFKPLAEPTPVLVEN